jgi:hypothetical protein
MHSESSRVYKTKEEIEYENEEYSECEERSVYDSQRSGYSITEQANIASSFDRQIVESFSTVPFQPREHYADEDTEEARKVFTPNEISFRHRPSKEEREEYEKFKQEHFN